MSQALLAINAGYVDTAGFLALQGLFTAHVTGNFVTIGAALVFGTSGVTAKLLALPVFCLTVALVRLFSHALTVPASIHLRTMMGVQFVLLLTASGLAFHYGPFPDADAGFALITGMILVCAMAVQNAVQRIHFGRLPPATIMTGNTTQLVIDLIDLPHALSDAGSGAEVRQRLSRTAISVAVFAAGCTASALMFAFAGMLCFALPPLLILVVLLMSADAPARTA